MLLSSLLAASLLGPAAAPTVQDGLKDLTPCPPLPNPAEQVAEPPRADQPNQDVLSGQLEAAQLSPAALASRHDRLHLDRPGGSTWWVRGRTYKASFARGGVAYIPFLGSQAPRNFPLELRLVQAQAGGQLLTLDLDVAAKSGGDAMHYERGPLTETYRLGLESVEQTFTFHDPTSGPLEVTVEFASELQRAPEGQGSVFRGDHGSVHMAAAFAVDAKGWTLPLETVFEGTAYHIQVPAHYVSQASFPVTIDPVLSTGVVDGTAAALTKPKAAYSPSLDRYLIAYEEAFSSTDGDVYSAELTGGVPSPAGYVDMTAERWFDPAVACARADDVMLVAAARNTGAGTDGEVMARLASGTLTYDAPIQLSTSSTGPKLNVTAGSDPNNRFFVVWTRVWEDTDHDVHARMVDSTGNLIGGEIYLDNSPADYRKPSSSNYCGATDLPSSAWMVVAEFHDGSGERSIVGARVGRNGAIDQPFFTVYDFGDHFLPTVSSPLEVAGEPTYLVTWMRQWTGDTDIYARSVQGTSLGTLNNLSNSELPGPTYFDDEFGPRVDSNGQSFTMAWRDGTIASPDATYLTSLTLVDGEVCVGESVELGSFGVLDPYSVVAGTLPGPNPTFAIFSENESPTTLDIRFALYQGVYGCLGTSYCGSVANSTGFGARIAASGEATAGTTATLYASRLPLNQFGYFLVSRTQGFSANPGGSQGNLCLGGTIGRYVSQIQNSGTSGDFAIDADTSSLPLVLSAVQPGDTLHFQAWYRDGNPSPTSNFTDGVAVQY